MAKKKEEERVPPTVDDSDAKAKGGEEGAEGEGGEGEGGEKPGGKKKIIIIAAVLILLLGGGGAGLFFSGILGGHAKKPAAEGEAETAKQEGGVHLDKEGKPEGAYFLQIPDMLVNLSADEGQKRYLRLSVQLEVGSENDKKLVEAIMPRVVDQFQTYLRELRVKDLRGSAGIYRLQMELLNRVNAAAAPVEVKDVLFQEILIQ